MKAMRIVIAAISAAAVTAAAFGQPSSAPAPAPVASSARRVVTGAATGAMQRLIVILKPAGGAPPDIASLGGSVEFRLPDRMIVTVPATAVAAIEQNPSVAYVQRSLRAGEQPGLAASPILSRTPQESRARVPQTGGAQWKTGAYVYDGAGNISDIGTGIEPNSDGLTNTYRYDKVGRLVTGTANYAVGNYNEVYGYDPFGNMTSRTTNKPGGQQEVVSTTIEAATNHIEPSNPNRYDAAGNEVADPNASTRHFDSLNMITHKQTSVTDDYYIYTPDDQRIGVLNAKAPSTWTWSLRDEGGSLLRQYSSSEATPGADWLWIEDYVYAGNRLLGAERVAAQGGRRHFHLDHLGTPRLITGLNGVLIARHDYLPFGREVTPGTELIAGSDRAEPKRFTGHERDSAETDPPATLDYMHARYYNAKLGRFLSVDPAIGNAAQPQSWNRYAYVLDDPISKLDPTGKADKVPWSEILIFEVNVGWDNKVGLGYLGHITFEKGVKFKVQKGELEGSLQFGFKGCGYKAAVGPKAVLYSFSEGLFPKPPELELNESKSFGLTLHGMGLEANTDGDATVRIPNGYKGLSLTLGVNVPNLVIAASNGVQEMKGLRDGIDKFLTSKLPTERHTPADVNNGNGWLGSFMQDH